MDLGLQGKVVLVTGSSRGIGLAEARLFAAEGARVAINGVDRDRAEQAAAQIRADGGDAQAFPADVTRGERGGRSFRPHRRRARTLRSPRQQRGSRGPAPGKPADETSEADWDAVVDSHLRATWLCLRAALPAMRAARWGRIVNTSSIHHTGGGRPGLASYAAAKGAISAFSRTVAKEVAGDGITVNTVAPGFVAPTC